MHAPQIVHGKASTIKILVPGGILTGMPPSFEAARYHSLLVAKEGLPSCLEVTAESEGGEIMALQHKEQPTYGVQFHPESIMTPDGRTILRNFLQIHI